MSRARQIEERHALAEGLADLAAAAMPPDKAEEFAAQLGQPMIDRRKLKRIAPAVLPRVTIDDPVRRPRNARPKRRARALVPTQLPLI